jgi:hypothetical protein
MSPLMKPARLALPAKAHPWQITPDQFFTACQSVRSDSFPLSRVYLVRADQLGSPHSQTPQERQA